MTSWLGESTGASDCDWLRELAIGSVAESLKDVSGSGLRIEPFLPPSPSQLNFVLTMLRAAASSALRAAARPTPAAARPIAARTQRFYHANVLSHYENPRNVSRQPIAERDCLV